MRSNSYTRQKRVLPTSNTKTNVLSPYQPLPILSRELRFKNSQSSGQIVTLSSDQIAGCIGLIALNPTQGYMIASSIRVNSIEIIGPSSNTSDNISIKLIGGPSSNRCPDQAIYGTSTSAGLSYLKWIPPKGSLVSTWLPTGNNFAILTIPAYAIVRIQFQYQLSDASIAAPYGAIGYVSSGMTAAYMYYPCLDGSTRFVPQIGLTVY